LLLESGKAAFHKFFAEKFIMVKTIRQVLAQNPSVVFAYHYGSSTDAGAYNDIDIAVYSAIDCDPFTLSADLKIALAEKTGKSPDTFDVRVINHLLRKGDLFALLYLKDVLGRGELLIDNSFRDRASFIEAFSMKYRECEGLIAEVCA
jgi:predicted nucleotidyltransferase